eukprot:m51a1_g1950 hypothetical protein (1855) ;mRNA; r:984815-1006833
MAASDLPAGSMHVPTHGALQLAETLLRRHSYAMGLEQGEQQPPAGPVEQRRAVLHFDTREHYGIYRHLRCMPCCVESMRRGVRGDTRPLEGAVAVCVQHIDEKTYGALCVLREWGATRMYALFVGYNAAVVPRWLRDLDDIPAELLQRAILETAGGSLSAEPTYTVSPLARFEPPLPAEELDRAMAAGGGMTYLEANRCAAAYIVLRALASGVAEGRKVVVFEDGGYLNPILDEAIEDGLSPAAFRARHSAPPDAATDAVLARLPSLAAALRAVLVGTCELTRNGYDATALLYHARALGQQQRQQEGCRQRQREGHLNSLFFSIAASYEKVMLEGDDIALACIAGLDQVLYSAGWSLSRRRVAVLGARGNLGRRFCGHLLDALGPAATSGDADRVVGVDLKVRWPAPGPLDTPAWQTPWDTPLGGGVREYASYREVPEGVRKRVDVVFGWTGGPVADAADSAKRFGTFDGEDLAFWLASGTPEMLFLVSGSTKTAEFEDLLVWLDRALSLCPEELHSLGVQGLRSITPGPIPDALTLAAASAAGLDERRIRRTFGTLFTFEFASGAAKTVYLVNNTMPVNFLFYGTPTEIMDMTFAQVTSATAKMFLMGTAPRPLDPSRIYAVDYSREATEDVYLGRFCNSSRLHLSSKGEVVLRLEIRNATGSVVSRVYSQPFVLCSKSTLQGIRGPADLPTARQLKELEQLVQDNITRAILLQLLLPRLVSVAVDPGWLAAHNLGPKCVWKSRRSAVLCMGSIHTRPLAPCSRCCQPFGRPNVLLGCSETAPEPAAQGAELVFVFDDCRSELTRPYPTALRYCNSSRLHLGGMVVLCLEIADGAGAVVARLRSQPFALCSKSSLQALRSRSRSAAEPLCQRTRVAPLSPTLGPASLAAGEHELQGIDEDGDRGEPSGLARTMDELEQMRQQNMTRVLLISQLLTLAQHEEYQKEQQDDHDIDWDDITMLASMGPKDQSIDGIPIVGAVLKVRVPMTSYDTVVIHLTLSKEVAVVVAQRAAEAKDGQARCGEARRVVLRPGMANGEPGPNLPAWEVLCGTADVYVSTQSPSVLALNPRKAHLVSAVYDQPTGQILWKSGQGPSSDPEINTVVDGIATAEKIWKSFSGRDCYDNNGSTIKVEMHLNLTNAFYSKRVMSFGLDFVSQTILWHEYGHGVTDFLDHMICNPDDNAGVHINSLIPSHAFAMLTDGSVKHGIAGVGLNASMKIFTRAKFLSTPMTTFALYASYLTTACEQLKATDSSITASTCSSLAGAIAATEMSGTMPCFSSPPSFIVDDVNQVAPRIFEKGAKNLHFTMYVGGNFSGATLRWSGGATGVCDMSSVKPKHLDPRANASNPIWAFQVQCPVPESVNNEENVTISLSSTDTFTSMPVYWTTAPVIDKVQLVTPESIDIYSQNLLPQAAHLLCNVDHGFALPCLMVFLCNKETINPTFACNIIIDQAFRTDIPGVLRAKVHTGPFIRGKYFIYVSQHSLNPFSNAASFVVKNANASLEICFDLKNVHVVVAEAMFGNVSTDTDSSGCAKFDLEQGIEYTVSATKDNYLTQVWQQTLTKSTESVSVAVDPRWLAAHDLSPSCIWKSGRSAVLCPDSINARPLAPCPKCCQPSGKPNVLLGYSAASPDPAAQGAELVFVFDDCRSYCNSSRLHLGGMVVLCLEIADGAGAVVVRLRSQPFALCSKSSLQALSAALCLESSQHPLAPCPKCCQPSGKPNVLLGCSETSPEPAAQGAELVFVFDDCRSYCNSSRLHLGGMVVLCLEIADGAGAVVARLRSQPFALCSKSSLQALSCGACGACGALLPEGAESGDGLARTMRELEQMRQQNMARVLLISQLLALATQGTLYTDRP